MTIAVANSGCVKWGCPYCGYRSASSHMSCGGTALMTCGECHKDYVMLANGVTESAIGLGSKDMESVYPELEDHPRAGIPSHGRPDKRPDKGEFFASRGVGTECGLGCFVCGASNQSANIAAFVQCKASGERVVAMFGGQGAVLDHRRSEPDYIQVKVGACDEHMPQLQRLHSLTEHDGILTEEIIALSSGLGRGD